MASALPTATKQWLFVNTPSGMATTEGSNPTFKLVTSPLPALKDKQVLVKTLYLSNDPAQRGWISPIAEPGRFYAEPVPKNTPMRAHAFCQVLDSRDQRIIKGAFVLGSANWSEYAVLNAKECTPVPPLPRGLSNTHYLGALGATGLTAYYGLVEVVRAVPTDVIVVSGAAGATGSMVVKLAKHFLGARKIVGIAGGTEKCEYVKRIGADECVDYKSKSLRKDLWRATGRQANVYFDNVGGKILDLTLSCMARNARIAICGAIASYNDEAPHALRNWHEIIAQRIEMKGFVVFDFWPKRVELLETLHKAIAEGKLKLDEGSETVVSTAFEDIPKTWLKLFAGGNTGKLVTDLSGASNRSSKF